MTQTKIVAWVLAVLIAVGSAVFQRMTGPTHPKRISIKTSLFEIDGKLPRSGYVTKNQLVSIRAKLPDSAKVFVQYRKYRYEENWTEVEMKASAGDVAVLEASLPKMPAAGKLEYTIFVQIDEEKYFIEERSMVIRFKGEVATTILAPHIFFIFFSMIMANYTALSTYLLKKPQIKWVLWTMALLLLGGFVYGPLVQKAAFGEYWTGFPFGYDLTDNKVLIAMIAWLWALKQKSKPSFHLWIYAAFAITFIIFLIPHSLLGSELNYNTMEIIQK